VRPPRRRILIKLFMRLEEKYSTSFNPRTTSFNQTRFPLPPLLYSKLFQLAKRDLHVSQNIGLWSLCAIIFSFLIYSLLPSFLQLSGSPFLFLSQERNIFKLSLSSRMFCFSSISIYQQEWTDSCFLILYCISHESEGFHTRPLFIPLP